MPRVPTYDSFQVAEAPMPQARFSAPDMPDPGRGAQEMGQAMQRAGGALTPIAIEMQQQANQVRVNDAMNKAVSAKLKLTYDPAEGFVHLRGDAALTRPDGKGLEQEYGQKLKEQLDQIAQSLGNEQQRAAFSQHSGQMAVQFGGSINQHVAKEYGDFQLSVQDGTINVARDQMALGWGDAKALDQSRGAIKAAVVEQGRLKGLSAVQVEANMVEALSPGHAAVIASAVDAGKLDYAREYMKQANAELTPAARLQITKVLETGDFEQKAQTKSEAIYAKHKGDPAAALAEARATLSGKEEDAVVSRIKTYDGERVALRERGQKDAADTAWSLYSSGQKVPPSVLSAMDGRDLATLRAKMKSDAEGKAVKTDVATWLKFTDMPVEQLAKITPQELMRDYRMHLSDADLRNAQHVVLSARAQIAKKPGETEGLQIMTTTDLVKRSAKELGILPESGAPSTKQETQYSDFTDGVQTKVNQWEAANGKKATAEVVREILKTEKLNQVRVNEWFTDPTKAVISLTPDEMKKAYVTVKAVKAGDKDQDVLLVDIPAPYRADAIARRRNLKLAVTEESIARMWVADGKPAK